MGFLPAKLTRKQLAQDPMQLLIDTSKSENVPTIFLAISTKILEKHAHIEAILEVTHGILSSMQRQRHTPDLAATSTT